MASPLHRIDPVALARSTVEGATDRAMRILRGVDLRLHVQITDGSPLSLDDVRRLAWPGPTLRAEDTLLGSAIVALTRYAQHGADLDVPVAEYLVSLVGPCADEDLDELEEPGTELGTVVTAALTREDLEEGRAVSTSRLAVLAGVTGGRVRQLVASGDLRGPDEGLVHAEDARRWLSGRGVVVVERGGDR